MRKTRVVKNLNTDINYIFSDCTPMEALQKMIYTLNINGKCNAQINKTKSGKHLWFEYNNETYTVESEDIW